MENKQDLKLLRPRSMAAVVSDGYRLYMSTFRSLFRSSWPVAIVYAFTFALFMGNIVNIVIPMQVTIQSAGQAALPPAFFLSVGAVLLYVFAVPLLAAQAVSIFREHSTTGDVSRPKHWFGRLCLNPFLRLLVVGVWMILLSVVIHLFFTFLVAALLSLGIVGSLWRSVASMGLLAILLFIVIALCIPLYYTVTRVVLAEGKVRFGPPVVGYGRGMRHWGLLFATVLVVYIFTGLLTLVCELPAVIMAGANALAYVGLAKGDPLGLPEGIVPLTYCVFFVAGFIQAYVHLSMLYPIYYAYGSIEQQEAERKSLASTASSEEKTDN